MTRAIATVHAGRRVQSSYAHLLALQARGQLGVAVGRQASALKEKSSIHIDGTRRFDLKVEALKQKSRALCLTDDDQRRRCLPLRLFLSFLLAHASVWSTSDWIETRRYAPIDSNAVPALPSALDLLTRTTYGLQLPHATGRFKDGDYIMVSLLFCVSLHQSNACVRCIPTPFVTFRTRSAHDVVVHSHASAHSPFAACVHCSCVLSRSCARSTTDMAADLLTPFYSTWSLDALDSPAPSSSSLDSTASMEARRAWESNLPDALRSRISSAKTSIAVSFRSNIHVVRVKRGRHGPSSSALLALGAS